MMYNEDEELEAWNTAAKDGAWLLEERRDLETDAELNAEYSQRYKE